MAVRTQLKLLLFLIVLGITAGTFALAFWAYKNILSHDSAIADEIVSLKGSKRPPPDPGAHHFNAAVDLIRANKLDVGRDGLYKLLRQFPRSPTTAEAKRIIGEMNLDALYAHEVAGGKRDYIVQPGDNLLAIAGKHQTTLEAIARVNGLSSFNLQPGDHLFIIPMNFDLVVDQSSKHVTVMREGRFFREYTALDLKLPPTMKIPVTLEVSSKSAINPTDGKAASPVSISFLTSEKKLILSRSGSKAVSLIVSAPVIAKAIPVAPGTVPKAIPVDSEPEETVPTSGVFIAQEDLEEIYPLLRRGSTVTLVE